MAVSIAKFHDRERRPPRGGWHFPIGNNNQLERHSEPDILAAVKKWRQNNDTFVSDIDVEREVWEFYCNREPARCKHAQMVSLRTVVPSGVVEPREVTKEMQGPPMWMFLNTLAVQWTAPLQDYFLHTCDSFISIMICPICRDEWRSLLRTHPPTDIDSRLGACRWVNWVHNKVNERLGKQPYPYERMVIDYGAPLT